MHDLISRQAAIDAVERNAYRHTYIDQIVDIIKALPSVQPDVPDTNVGELIRKQDAIDTSLEFFVEFLGGAFHENAQKELITRFQRLPSAQPERLTDDDFETIRIHLNAYKETLCNQHRWEEAEVYQRIIDRFMAFASAQPRKGKWIDYSDEGFVECPFCHSATNCDGNKDELHYCFSCGAELR